jgi:hypothetical protein
LVYCVDVKDNKLNCFYGGLLNLKKIKNVISSRFRALAVYNGFFYVTYLTAKAAKDAKWRKSIKNFNPHSLEQLS